MAKPRVFVSSTYYDLKHIRSSLDSFIESLGFEPVLSEKGDIPFSPTAPLDESCYREAAHADIFVLIIGGRYGSQASSEGEKTDEKSFFERYDSITKKEFEAALEEDVPVYILIEATVLTEYRTFCENRDKTDITYAHVGSVNIFRLLDDIIAMKRNNPMHPFERAADIEAWLRDQWAGLFRELLGRQAKQKQLESLSAKIADLGQTNQMLRAYTEELIRRGAEDNSEQIIGQETKRLDEARASAELHENSLFSHLVNIDGYPQEVVAAVFGDAGSLRDLVNRLQARESPDSERYSSSERLYTDWADTALLALNKAKEILGLEPVMKD